MSFTGVSQFASDYQAVLNRAVAIADLPLTQLQNQDTAVLSQETALGTLNTDVSNLASSLSALGTLASNEALSAASSNPDVVTATATGATGADSYTINSVTSVASEASETSLQGYADSSSTPVSSTGTMKLVVGSQSYTFTLGQGDNNLAGLENQINNLGAGVTAQILTTSTGNYLSVAANQTGATTIQLMDDPTGANTNFLTYTPASVTSAQMDASFANANSTPVSSSPTATMKLVVGSTPYTFSLTNNTLTGLEQEINSLNAGVTASIVTNSNGSTLQITSNSGPTNLQLIDDPTGANINVLQSQGTNAVFQLNGINISQTGNTVNSVIPGLTFNILGTSSTPTTLSLSSDPTQLASALQSFVTGYNALATDIQGQVGTSGGALVGDTVVTQLQEAMQQLTSYTTSSGTVQSLSDLGIEFDDTTGQATFDQTTFDSLSSTQIADAFKYIGSATTGLGGFSQNFTAFSDPVTGMIQAEVSGLQNTDQDLQSQISTMTDQINTMQTNLLSQLEAADAAEANLQSQQQSLEASLVGLNYVLYGTNTSQTAL